MLRTCNLSSTLITIITLQKLNIIHLYSLNGFEMDKEIKRNTFNHAYIDYLTAFS